MAWRIATELAETSSQFWVGITRHPSPIARRGVEFYAIGNTAPMAQARAAELVRLLNRMPEWAADLAERDE